MISRKYSLLALFVLLTVALVSCSRDDDKGDAQAGTLRWSYGTGDIIDFSSPAIGSDGTVSIGSYDKKLHAINPDGTEKWTFKASGPIKSSPAIGNEGTIYAGSGNGNLYALNPDGTLKWDYVFSERINSDQRGSVTSSPAIGKDGTVYVGAYDGMLHALYGGESLADSPWPMFRHNSYRTGMK
jgi:outer membrane protein assembly factor BamB